MASLRLLPFWPANTCALHKNDNSNASDIAKTSNDLDNNLKISNILDGNCTDNASDSMGLGDKNKS
ncbi:hypothetical protein [Gilliamella intestini]|uniref:hypothetical protein n=1 Tax=Gilliamella intestini TaxID=1798183 RepID=UPI000B861D21|nr:hypothetical protein [Gilliamella intestini]